MHTLLKNSIYIYFNFICMDILFPEWRQTKKAWWYREILLGRSGWVVMMLRPRKHAWNQSLHLMKAPLLFARYSLSKFIVCGGGGEREKEREQEKTLHHSKILLMQCIRILCRKEKKRHFPFNLFWMIIFWGFWSTLDVIL